MRAGDSGRLLDAWDQGASAGAPFRARVILQEFAPELDDRQLGAMSLGARDRALLGVRQRLFGDWLAAAVACGACGERLEITFDAGRLMADRTETHPHALSPAAAGDSLHAGSTHSTPPYFTLRTADGIEIVARPPSVGDFELASRATDARAAQRILLSRCIASAHRASDPVAIDDLTQTALQTLSERLEEADPDASIELEAHCPRCQEVATYSLDVAAFLWTEIETEALRLLHDVHRLARGYGWRETDILAMSPVRRRAYMELLPA